MTLVTKKEQSCVFLYSNWVIQVTIVFIMGGQICFREFSKYLKLGNFFLLLTLISNLSWLFLVFFCLFVFLLYKIYTIINLCVCICVCIFGYKIPFTILMFFNSSSFPLTATIKLSICILPFSKHTFMKMCNTFFIQMKLLLLFCNDYFFHLIVSHEHVSMSEYRDVLQSVFMLAHINLYSDRSH